MRETNKSEIINKFKSAGYRTAQYIIDQVFLKHIREQAFGGTSFTKSNRAFKDGGLTMVDTGKLRRSYEVSNIIVREISELEFSVIIEIVNKAFDGKKFYATFYENKNNRYLRGGEIGYGIGSDGTRQIANMTPEEFEDVQQKFMEFLNVRWII